jgi:hypothetical protein
MGDGGGEAGLAAAAAAALGGGGGGGYGATDAPAAQLLPPGAEAPSN